MSSGRFPSDSTPIRRGVQWLALLLSNPKLANFTSGRIVQGPSKSVCVPFLNCYSCPAAIGSCPVGAFQSLAAGMSRMVSLYIIGFLTATGAVAGRFICGWLCPFGLIQELLHKFRPRSWRIRLLRLAEALRYPALILTVLLPFYWRSAIGLAEPYFCKYVCPAGTLEAGLPLVSRRPELAALIGPLFWWKVFLLAVVLIASILIWRPFCRTLCPLGAFYGLFNHVSLLQLNCDNQRCTSCRACSRRCPADLDPYREPNSDRCVRCLECTKVCPTQALRFGIPRKDLPRHAGRQAPSEIFTNRQ